ncbi:hypothetical protein EYZ11_011908 [Aspergillus tanneri]|uniref:Uncharacterized protein n=1 Tax=Aspergillus tanneri TaxID=1220188 RepID=A0A4S3J6Y1_9EURO|nr:uncharacterized protein ATNIH1004_011542 [Aspergillus tanneri]KAA8642597.1 hypothetical protein ATNIH1004_011542 [Aspergillus tanneri]THC88641.1 hypothetical protein EYZ11_011908 [Aspergillus tanneri]
MYQTIIPGSRPQSGGLTNRVGSRDNSSNSPKIPIRSLYVQRAVWITAGGGMAATLQGVYMMLRSFRGFKYF